MCADGTISPYPDLRAGRGRFNWAYVATEEESSPLLWQPGVADHESGTVDDFLRSLRDHSTPVQSDATAVGEIVLIGEKTPELDEAMAEIPNVHLLDEVSSMRRAGQLARLAAMHIEAGNVSSISALSPLYLRSP